MRSASVRLGRRESSVAVATVMRATRAGRLRVRLPHRWRGVISSRMRSVTPRLVVKLRLSKGSGYLYSPVEAPAPYPWTAPQPSAQPPSVPSAPAAPEPGPPVAITGRAYYVSATGSDSNAGTSRRTAWRTVTRANRASLGPGDGIFFEGGATFSDEALMPRSSGAEGAPLVFGSYGTGKAILTGGAWFMSKSWLSFTGLSFIGASQGVSGSINGTGSHHIVVQDSSFSDLGIGINAANQADSDWTLRDNHIDGTGDSGVILLGDGHVAENNTILNTGTDSTIPYGKHGIYLKSANSRVTGNTIRNFEANGISSRYHSAVIEDNVISGGRIGIAWFQNDPDGGTSLWRNNTVSDTTGVCLYVSPSDDAGSTRESFVVSGNRLSRSEGDYTDFQPTSGDYTLLPNVQP